MDDAEDLVVPIIREELHTDAVRVVTGGVRVTKRVKEHEEIVEQELRKSHVEVKRVKTERVVDGPQPVQRVGKTLIVPIVSEVLRIQKQWVITEEIHITEAQERETVQHKVTLNREQAEIERLDSSGDVVSPVQETNDAPNQPARPTSILHGTGTPNVKSRRKTLSRPRSMLKNRRSDRD